MIRQEKNTYKVTVSNGEKSNYFFMWAKNRKTAHNIAHIAYNGTGWHIAEIKRQ